jgi:hypothetical protein
MNFDQAVSAIQKQSDEYTRLFSAWTEADFRREIDAFGTKSTRGSLLVNLVLGGHAAYRTQLFCYLKSCGRRNSLIVDAESVAGHWDLSRFHFSGNPVRT